MLAPVFDKEAWFIGQREALSSALEGAPMEVSLGLLVRTATEQFGEDVRAGFYLANLERTALQHIVGMPAAYAEAVHGFKVGPDSLACGLATHTGRPVLTADVTKEPLWEPWLWLAEQFDYRGVWSFPVQTTTGYYIGTLAVYWRQPREASARDLELAAMLTQAAGIIIARHRDAEVRQRAEEALRGSEERFRVFTQATFDSVFSVNADCTEFRHILGPNSNFETLQTSPGWLDDNVLPEDRQLAMDSIRQAIRSKSNFEVEYRGRQPNGTLNWTHSRVIPILNTHGEVIEWFGASRDVSQRKQAEETHRLLLNELNHRVKNTLAVVQAIAQLTSTRARDPAEFAKSFGERIQSLARAHTLLSSTNWQGAELRELVRDSLLAGTMDEARITVSGPSVRLDPQEALHISLMVHELATNAAKYGALSNAVGQVTVRWTTDDAIHIEWTERGGPAVTTPSTRGFGTTLIQQGARGQGGDARMLCGADGITWNISLPLRKQSKLSTTSPVRPSTTSSPPTSIAPKSSPVLSGRRILVVEDEPLIGLDIVAALEGAQAQVEGPVATAETALEVIERMSLDGALIDANLHGEPVDLIASALSRRNVPFIFVTGHGRDGLPVSFRDVQMLSKPCSPGQVVDAAAHLVTKKSDVVHLRR